LRWGRGTFIHTNLEKKHTIFSFFISEPVNNIAIKFETIPINSSFSISYEEISNDYFDEIVFTVLNDVHRKPKAADNKQVEFTSLDAGTLYTVKVQTVSGGEKSEIKSLQAQTCEFTVVGILEIC
jgi:hypothetical protein